MYFSNCEHFHIFCQDTVYALLLPAVQSSPFFVMWTVYILSVSLEMVLRESGILQYMSSYFSSNLDIFSVDILSVCLR